MFVFIDESMTLDQLNIFLEVARHEHITHAARALNMTQSAVSAAIASLEKRHNAVLFDRIGRGIVLTEVGRQFIPLAQEVLQRAKDAESTLAGLTDRFDRNLRIEASQTVANYWLPNFLIRYRKLYPQIELSFQAGNTSTAVAAILDGSADLAVVEGHVTSRDLVAETVAEDQLTVLIGPSHPWADNQVLTVDKLTDSAWVMREPGSGTRQAFDAELRRLRPTPVFLEVLLELPSNEGCIAAVKSGKAATVLSRRAAESHLAHGLLAEANFSLPTRQFVTLRHRYRHQSRAATAMLSLLTHRT